MRSSTGYTIRSTWTSCLQVFLCAALAFMGASRVAAQTVVSTHPRIWLTPVRLATLKNYASRNNGQGTLRWQTLKATADDIRTQVSQNNINYTTDCENIPPVALAYQVTGDKSYAQAAIKMLSSQCVSSNNLTNDDDYDYRYLPDFIAGYDWCYDQMTAAQRQQVATWMMDRADFIWPETNSSQAGAWAISDPADNYFYGFLMTWPAALAVYGDGTDTHVGKVSGANRPQYHLNLALSKFSNLVKPWANSWGVGGMFAESTCYDSTHYLGQILDAHLTATGQDFINASDFTYLHDSILWRIHSTTPDKAFVYHLGDHTQHIIVAGNLFDYDRMRELFCNLDLNDPTLCQYAKFWLDTIQPNMCTQSYTDTWEFLFYNEDTPSADYTQSLPRSYFASGPGIFLRRSDWTSSATYWGIWAGSSGESHQNYDNNGFLIYKGGALVGNGSMWSQDGFYKDTSYHNNMTFSGQSQQQQYYYPYGGHVVKQESGNDYGYFAGDSTYVYNNPYVTPFVNENVRKMIQVDPNLFMILDRVNLMKPKMTKEWHLHSHNPPVINGNSYSFDNGNYRLWGQTLLPTSGVTVTKKGIKPDYDPGVSSYEVLVTTNTGQALDYILNVLQLAPVSQSSVPTPQALQSSSGNLLGTVCGSWVVLAGTSETVSDTESYTLNTTVPTQDLVVDLQANVNYTIQLNNLSTGQTSSSSQTATGAGALQFSVPAGNYTVTLTPSTAGGGNGTVSLSSLTVSPVSVTGGSSAQGAVTLTGPAPSSGMTISLSSSNSAATLPGSVSVASGATSATFSISTQAVTSNITATLSATYNGVTKTATLTIQAPVTNPPPALQSLTVSPTSVTGGNSAQGTLTLSSVAPSGGCSIAVSSSNSAASVPATVTVAAGATSATFSISTTTVTTNTSVTLTASYNGVSKTASLSVQPPAASGSFVLGVCLGGPQGVTIEGNQWLSYSKAKANGLSVNNAQADPTSVSTFIPTPDAATMTMLSNCIWTSGTGFTLTQKLANGNYQVYVWEAEDGSNYSRTMNLILQGQTVATGIGSQTKRHWTKYGPYSASVSNGVLTLKVVRDTKGVPQLMGLAIFKQ